MNTTGPGTTRQGSARHGGAATSLACLIRSGEEPEEEMRKLYEHVRLYVNFFQPVMKLRSKSRYGARVHKTYDTAKTPYQRLIEATVLTAGQRESLAQLYQRLNPVQLKAQIDRSLQRLWTMAEKNEKNNSSVTVPYEATYVSR